jgi:hypothetical protein
MKSFRLDTNSIDAFIESWPALLAALAFSGALMYAGWFNATSRGLLIAFSALYFGYALRGRLTEKLRAEYPNAAHLWLVSIGMTSAALGVVARMLMPSLQGGYTDYIWIAISFSTLLAFVVINRRDRDVVK